MSYFCHQVSFTSSARTRLLQDTSGRFKGLREPIDSLEGKILSAFFALDSYDLLLLTDFPELVSSSDIDIALLARGDIARIHTTQLLNATQLLESARNLSATAIPGLQRAWAASAT